MAPFFANWCQIIPIQGRPQRNREQRDAKGRVAWRVHTALGHTDVAWEAETWSLQRTIHLQALPRTLSGYPFILHEKLVLKSQDEVRLQPGARQSPTRPSGLYWHGILVATETTPQAPGQKATPRKDLTQEPKTSSLFRESGTIITKLLLYHHTSTVPFHVCKQHRPICKLHKFPIKSNTTAKSPLDTQLQSPRWLAVQTRGAKAGLNKISPNLKGLRIKARFILTKILIFFRYWNKIHRSQTFPS